MNSLLEESGGVSLVGTLGLELGFSLGVVVVNNCGSTPVAARVVPTPIVKTEKNDTNTITMNRWLRFWKKSKKLNFRIPKIGLVPFDDMIPKNQS
jgi:hypothetical protein